jgi:hypothetical protein
LSKISKFAFVCLCLPWASTHFALDFILEAQQSFTFLSYATLMPCYEPELGIDWQIQGCRREMRSHTEEQGSLALREGSKFIAVEQLLHAVSFPQ